MSTSTTCKYTLTDSNGTSNEGTVAVEVLAAPVTPPSTGATPAELFAVPFNKNSAQNRPIGTGATYAFNADIQRMAGAGTVNNVWPNGNYAVMNGGGDALRSIAYYSVNSTGTPGFFPVSLRVPSGPWNTLSTVGDCGVAILDAEGANPFRLVELYRFNRNVLWTADSGRAHDIRGAGHANPGDAVGTRVGMTASGASYMLGVIRKSEVEARIPWRHCLHVGLPRLSGQTYAPVLSRDIKWPCSATDGNANSASHNTGSVAYGELLAIPPVSKGGPNLNSLGLTALQKILFECMRDYGAYITDGGSAPAFRCDAQLSNADFVELRAGVRLMWQHVRVVTNSVTGATATRIIGGGYSGSIGTPVGAGSEYWPAGGGTALATNQAYDA